MLSLRNDIITSIITNVISPGESDVIESNSDESDERTKQNLIQWVFVLLGISVLLPWNSFVSAEGYFEMRICREYHHEDGGNNTSGDGNGDVDDGMRNDGDESSNLILLFGFVYNGFGVLTLGIMLLVHKRHRRRRKRRAAKARIHHYHNQHQTQPSKHSASHNKSAS